MCGGLFTPEISTIRLTIPCNGRPEQVSGNVILLLFTRKHNNSKTITLRGLSLRDCVVIYHWEAVDTVLFWYFIKHLLIHVHLLEIVLKMYEEFRCMLSRCSFTSVVISHWKLCRLYKLFKTLCTTILIWIIFLYHGYIDVVWFKAAWNGNKKRHFGAPRSLCLRWWQTPNKKIFIQVRETTQTDDTMSEGLPWIVCLLYSCGYTVILSGPGTQSIARPQ